eukprot:4006410-Prymnesium_polylepis.3
MDVRVARVSRLVEAEESHRDEAYHEGREVAALVDEHKREREDPRQVEDLEQLAVAAHACVGRHTWGPHRSVESEGTHTSSWYTLDEAPIASICSMRHVGAAARRALICGAKVRGERARAGARQWQHHRVVCRPCRCR